MQAERAQRGGRRQGLTQNREGEERPRSRGQGAVIAQGEVRADESQQRALAGGRHCSTASSKRAVGKAIANSVQRNHGSLAANRLQAKATLGFSHCTALSQC